MLTQWVTDQPSDLKSNFIPTPTIPDQIDENKLWSLIQDWRVRNNLKPYIKDQRLCEIASVRLKDIQTDWSHKKFIAKRFCGNSYCKIAENLAWAYVYPETLLDTWLNSLSHAANLKANYRYSCIVTNSDYTIQVFGNF
jgi:uncharacterized protein YkwD